MAPRLYQAECGCAHPLDTERILPCLCKIYCYETATNPDDPREWYLSGCRADDFDLSDDTKAHAMTQLQRMSNEGLPFFRKDVLAKIADAFGEWRKPRAARDEVEVLGIELTSLLSEDRIFITNQMNESCCARSNMSFDLDLLRDHEEVFRLVFPPSIHPQHYPQHPHSVCIPPDIGQPSTPLTLTTLLSAIPLVKYHSYIDLTAPRTCNCQVHNPPHYTLGHAVTVHYLPQIRHRLTKLPIPDPNDRTLSWTPSQLRAKLHRATRKWPRRKTWSRITSALSSANLSGTTTKIIGIALGSLSELETEIFTQHKLILLLAELLREHNLGVEIKKFVQDPAYTDLDKGALRLEGVKVLEDPRAFVEVDEASVVVAIYPIIPAMDVIADVARPAVIVCHRLPEEEIEW